MSRDEKVVFALAFFALGFIAAMGVATLMVAS